MEYLVELLNRLIGDEATAGILFVVLVAVAIFLVVITILFVISGALDPTRRRVKQVAGHQVVHSAGEMGLGKIRDSASPHILPKEGGERSAATKKLYLAGFRSPNALFNFYAIKLLLIFILITGTLVSARFFPQFNLSQVSIGAVLAGLIGLMLPSIVVNRLYIRRQTVLRNAFPDALDLLVVCVEAGLGLTAAIQRVAEELAVSSPELSDELALVTTEIQVGVDRVQALRHLSDRTGLDDIRGLVTLLSQSLRFGTSIADTLRIFSEEFRDKRTQKAEERAAMIGTKMIFPLVLCIFPSFFIIVVGPAVLGMLKAFGR